jgi:hypothetical protein
MAELDDQGAASADGHDSAADAGSQTDTSPRPVDENGQENWAEDAEPLTRDEYAEQERQSETTTAHDSTADHDHDDTHDPAATDDGQEQEELPETRTRQEVASEASRAGTDTRDHDQPADTAIDAGTAEEDNLPEPRTRQEVAEEARSGADPLAHSSSDAQQHERDTGDWPSQEERARLHETYLDWRDEIATGPEQGTRWEQGANVVGDKPDKSPGDRSDLPPTGEELLDMDSDKLSRAEQFRREFYKEAGDVVDAVEKEGGMVIDLTERPPTGSHTEVPSHQPAVSLPADHATESGQVALAGLVAGVLVFETARRVRNTLEARRRR